MHRAVRAARDGHCPTVGASATPGKQFQASAPEYEFGGKVISEVLAMSVTETEQFFAKGEARTAAVHKVVARLADVERLLDRLVDAGKSVVVERHQAVMAQADRIVDLGPRAGHENPVGWGQSGVAGSEFEPRLEPRLSDPESVVV